MTEVEYKKLMKSPILKTRGILSQFRKKISLRDSSIKISSLYTNNNYIDQNSLID